MQLAEPEVNAPTLAGVFRDAFMDVSDVGTNSLHVKADKIKVAVTVMPELKCIRYSYHIKIDKFSVDKALQITNKLNEDYIFAQFAAVEESGALNLLTTQYMTYKQGLIKYHLIDSLATFEGIILEAGNEGFGVSF